MSTPTKTSLYVNIMPSKLYSCVVCTEIILNPDNRRKLLSGSAKTPVALKFETTLDIEFEKTYGNLICKKCLWKVDSTNQQKENVSKDCSHMVQQFKENL